MESVRVLVTGANGFLGQNLVRSFLNNSFEVIATGRGNSRFSVAPEFSFTYHSLDLEDNMGFEKLFSRTQPQVVVHAGAMTHADDCEMHRQVCYNINVIATKKILDLAVKKSSFFLFMSQTLSLTG